MLTSYEGDHVTPESKTFTICPLTGKCTKDQVPKPTTGAVQLLRVGQRWEQAKGTREGAERKLIKQKPNKKHTRRLRCQRSTKEGPSAQLYWVLATALGGRAASSHVLRTDLRNDEPIQQLLEKRGTRMLICQFPWCRHSQFKLPTVCQLTQKIPECPVTGACYPLAGSWSDPAPALVSTGWGQRTWTRT